MLFCPRPASAGNRPFLTRFLHANRCPPRIKSGAGFRPNALPGAFMHSPEPSAVTGQPSASRNRLVLAVYTSAIFVSALLLFSVQPLFTKMVLPRLGGSPAVWSVAMVFFQSLLLAGYSYAHLRVPIKSRVVPLVVQ